MGRPLERAGTEFYVPHGLEQQPVIGRHCGSDLVTANVCGARRRVVLLTVADGEPGGQQMRQARAQGFAGMTAQLVHLIRLASTAMRPATAALFSADPPAAESITAAYEAVSVLRDELEDHAAVLLGLRVQSGVLELLATIAAVHIDAETERIGQLAREVADIARTRRGWASISAPLLGVLRELSEVRFETAAKAADVVESHTATSAVELAARCHERFAEHARALTRYRALLAVGAPSGRGSMRGNPSSPKAGAR